MASNGAIIAPLRFVLVAQCLNEQRYCRLRFGSVDAESDNGTNLVLLVSFFAQGFDARRHSDRRPDGTECPRSFQGVANVGETRHMDYRGLSDPIPDSVPVV